MLDKKQLSLEDIDSQTILELPNRELPALIHIGNIDVNLLNGNQINVPIAAAANICGTTVLALLTAQATECKAVAGAAGSNNR